MPKNADQFDWTWIRFQLFRRPIKAYKGLVKKNKITKTTKVIKFACFKWKHNRILYL